MIRSLPIQAGLILLFIYFAISIPARAQLEDALVAKGFITITSDAGDSPVDTFEDVGAIKNIRIVVPDANTLFVSWSELMNLLSNHFDHKTLGRLQSLLNVPKAILGGPAGVEDAVKFYQKYAFLVRGPCPGCDKPGHVHLDGAWHYNQQMSWGGGSLDEPPHNSPDSIEYLAALTGGWRYVDPPKAWPGPHFTCDCHNRGCPSNVCTENTVPDPKPEDPTNTKTETDHKRAAENICYENANLKSTLETEKVGKKKEPEGTETFKITWKDRTPPRITGANGNDIGQFPFLGHKPGTTSTARRATTGDFFKPCDLTAEDNDGGILSSRFAIGRMNGPVDASSVWTPAEEWQWIGDTIPSISGKPLAKHVFLPNDCLGEMKYSVFVWDKNGILNPGCPNIVEDSPETTYGMNEGDLGRDPQKAKPFPYAYDPTKPLDPAQRFKDGEGKIWIDDNDLPNLMIRLVSKRDEGKPRSVLIFPPPAQGMSTFDPSYSDFIQNSYMNFEEIAAAPDAGPSYVKILDIDLGNCAPQEKSWKWKFNVGPQPSDVTGPFPLKFWYQNFRLEDYSQSDNDTDAEPIDNTEATFGKRNGFGKSAVVLCTVPVVEDVQYDISLWAEDNVKWLNDKENLLGLPVTSIPAPYTGIVKANLSYSLENVYPPMTGSVEVSPGAFCSKPLSVIFREPTPRQNPGSLSHDSLRTGKYPSVEASVTDYAGLTRTLKVYFVVTDEKTKIRVLEQKHLHD